LGKGVENKDIMDIILWILYYIILGILYYIDVDIGISHSDGICSGNLRMERKKRNRRVNST